MEELLRIELYLFEPEYADGESYSESKSSDIDSNKDIDIVGNYFWYSCALCIVIFRKENVCCQEWDTL